MPRQQRCAGTVAGEEGQEEERGRAGQGRPRKFAESYKTAYTTIPDRPRLCQARSMSSSTLGHDDTAAGRQSDRLFLPQARGLQGRASLVRARYGSTRTMSAGITACGRSNRAVTIKAQSTAEIAQLAGTNSDEAIARSPQGTCADAGHRLSTDHRRTTSFGQRDAHGLRRFRPGPTSSSPRPRRGTPCAGPRAETNMCPAGYTTNKTTFGPAKAVTDRSTIFRAEMGRRQIEQAVPDQHLPSSRSTANAAR